MSGGIKRLAEKQKRLLGVINPRWFQPDAELTCGSQIAVYIQQRPHPGKTALMAGKPGESNRQVQTLYHFGSVRPIARETWFLTEWTLRDHLQIHGHEGGVSKLRGVH